MKLHANARTCPGSRRLAVQRVLEEGWTLVAAAEAAGVSVRTLSKWLRRFREEGEQGLFDLGLGKLSRLEPPEPANRYERRHPGELVHIDVEKLARIKDGTGERFVGDGVRRTHNYARRAPTLRSKRFIRTMLAGWAYGAIYRDSAERRRALDGWLDFYNPRRPHGSLSHQPPASRLNNLVGNYT